MSIPFLRQIGAALRNLDPATVRATVSRPLKFGVLAADEHCVDDICEFLSPVRSVTGRHELVRIAKEEDFSRVSVGFAEHGVPHPEHFYSFDRNRPRESAAALLEGREDLWLPMACNFSGLRGDVSERLIWKIAKENALFTVTTSLPNIVPTVLVLPWAVGELASDTAFLTMNQIRLSFQLAAAHGKEVGYDRQSLQVGSIAGTAFGWRALARQIVSKLPAGAGLVPKGLIAFAGTYVVGRALEHWFREGSPLGRAARLEHFDDAKRRGREAVERIVEHALSASRTAVGRA